MSDVELLTFRPLDNHLILNGLQFLEGLEAVIRILQVPFPFLLLFEINGQVKNRAGFFNFAGLLFFKAQVASGLQSVPTNFGDDVFYTLPRFEIMAPVYKGFDKHLQSKTSAIGEKVHIDSGVRLNLFNMGIVFTVGISCNGRMDGHKR